jgi:uncharacterized membrane protein YcaP (DUF421 family)
MNEYLLVIISTAVVYFFLITAIIFFGKKELSQLSIIDLVFILLISNSVQNAMVDGDIKSLEIGIISSLTLFLINFLMKLLVFKSSAINKLVEGEPVLLIYHGRLIEKNLVNQKITHDELDAAIREHGIEKTENVNLAMLENDGNISVVSFNDEQTTMYKRKKNHPLKLK